MSDEVRRIVVDTAGVTSFFLPNMPKKPFRFGFLDWNDEFDTAG